MKKRSALTLFSALLFTLLCANFARATVSYWDPENFRGSYNTYVGAIPLSGSWDTNAFSRNADGSTGLPADQGSVVSQLKFWTNGDAVVFCVGAGATNAGVAASTTTFTVTMTNNYTIAGIFDGSLNNKSCKVTLAGTGGLTLSNGFDAFFITTNSDGSQGIVTLNVPLGGPGTLTAEGNGGQIFLNASNTFSGGTQIGFSNVTAFTGILNFSNNNSFGTGPIVISTGSSGAIGTLQCTNGGVTISNAVDFSKALSATPFLNVIGNAGGLTFSGPWTLGTNAANLGSGGVAANVLTISGPITGTAGFTKFNPGSLVLSGTNTYSGGTTISAGSVQVGTGGTSGSLGAGDVLDNGSLTFNRSDAITNNGIISGAGPVTQAGAGTLNLNAANTYAGITTISGGSLQLGMANAIPSGSPVKVGSGATLDLAGFSPTLVSLSGAGNVINNNGQLTVNGSLTTLGVNSTYSCFSGSIGGGGTLDKQGTHAMALRGANTFSGGLVQLEAGTLSVGAAPDRLPTGVTLLMSGGSTLQLDANNQTLAEISGSGFINLGGGTLTLNEPANSTFAGVIQNSSLAGSSTASGNGLRGYYYDNEDLTALKAVRDDATVNFGNFTVTNAVTGLPAAGIATNTFSVRWLGQVLTTSSAGSYTFTTTCDDGSRLWVNGTLLIDNWVDQGAIAKSNSIVLAANTRYDIVMEYYQNGSAASAVLSWTPPAGVSAVIPNANLFLPGPGALVKAGVGALNLTGQNTYTGQTYVGGGTLEISSAAGLASPTVTVTNGATLKLDNATALSSLATLILNTNGSSPTVNLNFAGSSSIAQISFDGGLNFVPGGSYGSPTSGAQHTSSRFTGNGLLNLGVCSSTNYIVGITNNGNHIVTLTMQGTFGAQYYLLTQTNVAQPIVNWQIVPGSTNQISAPNGIWSLAVSNPVPSAVYRVKAVSSCF